MNNSASAFAPSSSTTKRCPAAGWRFACSRTPDFEISAQCSNGREAIAAIASHQPDVVFLDIQMPGMSGFDVLTQLPQDSVPLVVFVTRVRPVRDSRLRRAGGRLSAEAGR